MSIKKSRLEIYIAIFLAVVFAIFVWVWLYKLESKQALVRVARAAENLEAPAVLKISDLEVVFVPREFVPRSAITKEEALVGQVLTRPLVKGSWFSEYDLVYGRDPNSDGTLLPPGSMGLFMPANWFSGQMPRVKPHDFVFVYAAAQPGKNTQAVSSGLLVANLPVMRVEMQKEQAVSGVLVGASDAQVKALAQARANQVALILVVASAEAQGSMTTSPSR